MFFLFFLFVATSDKMKTCTVKRSKKHFGHYFCIFVFWMIKKIALWQPMSIHFPIDNCNVNLGQVMFAYVIVQTEILNFMF